MFTSRSQFSVAGVPDKQMSLFVGCTGSNPAEDSRLIGKAMNIFSTITLCLSLFLYSVIALPAADFEEDRLEREILAADLQDGIQLQVAVNGDVYFIERDGALRKWSPAGKMTRTVGSVPVAVGGEYGLIGFALDRDFASNGWVYLHFSPKEDHGKRTRLSRFTIAADKLDLTSEKVLLSYDILGGHQGGGLQMDRAGHLWVSIADHAVARVFPATDERDPVPDKNGNALRTAANTQDLRGKILRIRPQPDGTYTLPDGNLFADAKQGRPEIFVMGCRNPFRFNFDDATGRLFWAEVGSNTEERFGTGGFDEISVSTKPANSGWPLFIGPNTPYRRYDEATEKLGDLYDPAHPVNESRFNTGLRDLPAPLSALLWYGSEDSKEFPELGNGGRSAMAGPVYHFDPKLASDIKLPELFDGRLFIYDWCRSWLKSVSLTPDGRVEKIEPFMAPTTFRRPIDMQLGPDGALYLIEFGDRWSSNKDGRLSRLLYRRGNRAPKAVITADVTAGAVPLTVKFSAATSTDADGDALSYQWTFGESGGMAQGREASFTYQNKGMKQAMLTVTDPQGGIHFTSLAIAVGNAPPVVRVTQPVHGGFFDWGTSMPFEISVSDAEDGDSIPAEKVRTRWLYRGQAGNTAEVPQIGLEGGATLMRKSDCLTCHQLATPSIGPTFLQVAERYRGDAAAPARLVEKVLKGGNTAWGEVPMPAHPQHTPADLAEMVRYILELQVPEPGEIIAGLQGVLTTPEPKPMWWGKATGGSYLLSTSYRDAGADGAPPLTTESRVVLHDRHRRAALYDEAHQAAVLEVSTLLRSRRICAQLGAGSHLVFKDVNLAGITRVDVDISASTGHGGMLELRADSPSGPLIGKIEIPETGQWDKWKTIPVPVTDPGGLHDLYVVAATTPSGEKKRFNLDTLHFVSVAVATKP